MSGVETRTRLEQLESLHRRTAHEIQAAAVACDGFRLAKLRELDERLIGEIEALGGRVVRPKGAGKPRSRRQKADDRVTRRLEQLGVSAHDVKVWAVSAGLVDRVRRGRIRAELVEAYAARDTTTFERTA